MRSPDFESAIWKIQCVPESTLNGKEKYSVSWLLLTVSPHTGFVSSLSIVGRAKRGMKTVGNNAM